ncbi:hypothetical protein FDP41_002289 [Naegleria fowleri]|uniref:Uncharacterized protein n=1 Tax=Naegleria fowleri TaxID=5763 RepID=A0A6A5BZQ0_NAEFO|nr:uncharacterized protein FDP41_002289 [Naegleria fowleri]KAF0978469.1 hypothetical protein FDP41_002289 [Naegleria fowleri]
MLKHDPVRLKTKKRFVVGVDFGSTGSGFAIALVNGDDIFSPKTYECAPNETYRKNLSAIMYDRGVRFQYGFRAQNTHFYADDDDDKESSDGEEATRSTSSAPSLISAKSFEEKDRREYFTDLKLKFMQNPENYLAMLLEHIMQLLHNADSSATMQDIRWCFSVPSHYDEKKIHLMREIAYKAKYISNVNAPEDDFMIVTEPEAASIYCLKNMAQMKKGVKEGETFMIMDAGGGTVDITCYEMKKGRLRELTIQNGNICGSKKLDEEFMKVLDENLDSGFITFKRDFPQSLLKLLQYWEDKKRNVKVMDKIKVEAPPAMDKVDNAYPSSGFFNKTRRGNNISLSKEHVQRIFDKVVPNILRLVDDQVEQFKKENRDRKVDYLFMVGGLSDNLYLQDMIKTQYGSMFKDIVFPTCSGNSVIQGGALLGKDPSLIRSRRAKLTYGISVMDDFDPEHHPGSKYYYEGGRHLCKDIFEVFVERGQEVDEDHTIQKEYDAVNDHVTIRLFSSPYKAKDVPFVDTVGRIQHLEDIIIPFPDKTSNDKRIIVKMQFGKAEILITAENAQGQKKEVQKKFEQESLSLIK